MAWSDEESRSAGGEWGGQDAGPIMTLGVGIALALGSSIAANLGFFLKHRGARVTTAVSLRHPIASANALWRSRWFAVGMIVGGGAWSLHVAAISLAPLSVVQVVLSSGVVLIAVMGERMCGVRVGRRQWWGFALTALGFDGPRRHDAEPHGPHASVSAPALVAFEAALLGMGGMLILGPRAGAPAEHHGVMLAAAAGMLFGVCNVAVKALSGLVSADGIAGLASPWLAMAAVASALAF